VPRLRFGAFTKQKDAAEWLQVPIEILSEFSDS
jgi:hypothetical protein